MNNIGYCCINMSMNIGKRKKDQIMVNRGMVKKTFENKGLGYVSELAILNINDFERIFNGMWKIIFLFIECQVTCFLVLVSIS
jgi:hypothetical protein